MHNMTLTEKVQQWLLTADLKTQGAEDCVRALGKSRAGFTYAMQREGVSFSTLLDRERKRRVADLLAHRGKAQAWVVAIAAGYRHDNSSCRAFQRWFGVTIREYNKLRAEVKT